ncbi:MAG: hypothetical protein LRY27_00685 [Chitinophagales bacterium]|nr:hypothetical protein [Chitinophagales bacterium]
MGVGPSIYITPKYKYDFRRVIENSANISFNTFIENEVKFKINDKFSIKTGVMYRFSKIHAVFTQNLVGRDVYYDFWQHTIGLKTGVCLLFNN